MYTTEQVERACNQITGELNEHPYRDDVEFIVSVAETELGVTITEKQADILWREYSEWLCASWLTVGRNRGSVASILRSSVLDSYLGQEE